MIETKSTNSKQSLKKLLPLSLTSLGVVYGDIGTSPIYALRECFVGASGFPVHKENIFGILSLIAWSLILVISIKYLVLVLRADNQGEGGILALAHKIIPDDVNSWTKKHWFLVSIGLFGAALLYGDGIITPALSVLSAVEGLKVATPFFEPYIVPLTIFILTGLFLIQHRGTEKVGKLFGPVTFIWFLVLTILGILQILDNPSVLYAFNPWYAIDFFLSHGFHGTLILGAVFLVVTGGEALYADLGHFGKGPIRLSWFSIVFPGLLLNYFGQGALLLNNPELVENVFYHMAPSWALYPLVFMTTLATIIASQAVISGVFSLTSQAVQMNYFPRTEIRHTSSKRRGQIYVPVANWLLFIGTISLVLNFKSSGNLAGAYGIAVSMTMIITTFLLYFVMVHIWHWQKLWAIPITVILMVIDFSFFSSIVRKVTHGGWIPLTIAGSLYLVMVIWRRGRQLLEKQTLKQGMNVKEFISLINKDHPLYSKGTVIYLVKDISRIPLSLLEEFKNYHTVHENIYLLHVNQCHRPFMTDEPHGKIEKLSQGFHLIHACFGYMEKPNISLLIRDLNKSHQLDIELDKTTFVLTKESVIPTNKAGLPKWAKRIFAFLYKNSQRITKYFNIRSDQVLEIDPIVKI